MVLATVPTMAPATVPAMGIRATSWMERVVPTMAPATVPAMGLARVPVRVPAMGLARVPTTVPVAVPLTAKARKKPFYASVAHNDDQPKRKSSKDKGRPRKKFGPKPS